MRLINFEHVRNTLHTCTLRVLYLVHVYLDIMYITVYLAIVHYFVILLIAYFIEVIYLLH